MTYGTQQNIWAIFVFSAIAADLLLILWLTIGIIKRNPIQIKSSVKFLINLTSSFGYSLFPFVYFGIWVTAPYGQSKQDSLNILSDRMFQSITHWYLWGFLWLSLLVIFNIFFQTKIDKHLKWKQIIYIFLSDFFIMSFGILFPAYCAYQSLSGDINMRTY